MHIRRVQQNDLYDFSRVVGRSMWNDEIMVYTAPKKDEYPDSFFRYVLHRSKVRFYRGEELFLAVTDESDPDWTGKEQVMGYCAYSNNIPDYKKPCPAGWLGNFFERKALDARAAYSRFFKLDRSSDPVAEDHFRSSVDWVTWDQYYGAMPQVLQEKVDGRHFELELLGTDPNYRRRGVGMMMLQEGFELAREHDVPLVLVASVIGEKLYLAAGFKEITRISLTPRTEGAKEMDFGLGPGNGLSWATMYWEPEGFRDSL